MRHTGKIGILLIIVLSACNWNPPTSNEGIVVTDTLVITDSMAAKGDTIPQIQVAPVSDTLTRDHVANRDTSFRTPAKGVDTKGVAPQAVVNYAKTLVGIPYVYGSTDPSVGFDCSGFITYTFNHFKIKVPRSSIDFTNVGVPVPKEKAKTGDLILFTGTNPLEQYVGHMGLVVTATPDSLSFIHSTSGKAMGVTITTLNEYYMKRFVKVIRIF